MPDEDLSLAIYNQLRRLARNFMRRERAGHSLEPTALVHEAYIRLTRSKKCDLGSRTHFLRLSAHVMREILIDHARARVQLKRGGGFRLVTLLDELPGVSLPGSLLNLDEALRRLEQLEPRAAQVVEMRFFAGMTEEEIAEALGISPSSVRREWAFARAWLRSQLHGSAE